MTLDEAKYNLNNKISEIKSLLRTRRLEIIEVSREPKLEFNGFNNVNEFKNEVYNTKFREVKMLIDYTYLHELDEVKRKKLAMYFVMVFSFRNHKKNHSYDSIYAELSVENKMLIEQFENCQESTRSEIIRNLKEEYFDLDEHSPFENLRIQWNGNLKQLAELFIELEQKQWISFNEGERKPVCKTISRTFFLKDGNKDSGLNSESFYTTFRPDSKLIEKKYSYKQRYSKVFTTQYVSMFKEIISNIKI